MANARRPASAAPSVPDPPPRGAKRPGGSALASERMWRAVDEARSRSGKPVIASFSDVAASGGYYVAAPCNWIVAHELTITGSIGVIMQGYNLRNLMDKVGVRPMVFKSGKHKDMLSYDKREEDITPEERKMVQDLIDETFGRFKKIVREGRDLERRNKPGDGKALSDDWEEQADGRILSGTQAIGQGFVDELGDLDTATERALKLAGHADANLIQYREPMNLASLFRLFGKSEPKSIKVDLGVDLPQRF